LLTASGELLTVATEVVNTAVGDITKLSLPTLVTASAKDDGTVVSQKYSHIITLYQ